MKTLEIDGDSLRRLSPVEAFVFGAEWGMVWEKAQSSRAATVWVHERNAVLVSNMLELAGRKFGIGARARGFVEVLIRGLD